MAFSIQPKNKHHLSHFSLLSLLLIEMKYFSLVVDKVLLREDLSIKHLNLFNKNSLFTILPIFYHRSRFSHSCNIFPFLLFYFVMDLFIDFYCYRNFDSHLVISLLLFCFIMHLFVVVEILIVYLI